jgi:hypothetical protein
MKENRFIKSLEMLEQNSNRLDTQQSTAVPETNFLAEIVTKIPTKSRGNAATYYLTKSVVQAVEREAKRRGVNKSKLVDEVLKRVFLEKTGIES